MEEEECEGQREKSEKSKQARQTKRQKKRRNKEQETNERENKLLFACTDAQTSPNSTQQSLTCSSIESDRQKNRRANIEPRDVQSCGPVDTG